MLERAPKPTFKSLPTQRVSQPASPAPAAAASAGASALPRFSFASLAVHPPGRSPTSTQLRAGPARPPRPNRTGLPDRLKTGVEALSGVSLDEVKVHYNSPRPAQLDAHAYARGREIHLAPGQERHLPHETWHLVQQAQGRVRPTMQTKDGVPVNDHAGLEQEASVMGARATQEEPQMSGQMPGRGLRAFSGPAVLQPFWELGPDGKVVWKEGKPPDAHIDTGQKKKGAPVFAAPTTMAATKAEEARAAKAEQDRLERLAAGRAIPRRSRKAFAPGESERLAEIPKMLVREDQSLRATKGQTGRRKAHLVNEGLATAGTAPISATEQMDQDSVRKARGNRISSKLPLESGEQDDSQNYGGQKIGIKAQKIERARLRGKGDAQHIRVHTPEEIQGQLDRGPQKSDSGKQRHVLKGFAKKDREYHHEVGFHSPSDPRHFIPNRFLKIDGEAELHDSDSDSDSGAEGEEEKTQPVKRPPSSRRFPLQPGEGSSSSASAAAAAPPPAHRVGDTPPASPREWSGPSSMASPRRHDIPGLGAPPGFGGGPKQERVSPPSRQPIMPSGLDEHSGLGAPPGYGGGPVQRPSAAPNPYSMEQAHPYPVGPPQAYPMGPNPYAMAHPYPYPMAQPYPMGPPHPYLMAPPPYYAMPPAHHYAGAPPQHHYMPPPQARYPGRAPQPAASGQGSGPTYTDQQMSEARRRFPDEGQG